MSKKIRLMELCLSPDLGGLELFMVRSAKALHESMNVISVINKEGKLEPYFQGSVHRYTLIEKRSNLVVFGAARRLARIIDEEQIDLVHLHWTADILVAVLAKILSKRKPKLIQTRNMTMTRFKNDFYHRFLYSHMDAMHAVTHQVALQLHKFIPDSVRPKVEVIYMGSDSPIYLNSEGVKDLRDSLEMKERFVIGMVGRINEAKGQHLLIKALAAINDPVCHAYFVGHEMQKGYTDTLKHLAHELQVQDQVHFLGFMNNPHHFYQACDAAVLASKNETFGLVLIEAMNSGTAVIGSNSGGVIEIIDDEKTGLLFESGNSDALSVAIKRLRNDETMRKRLAANGRAKAQAEFSNEKQFQKMVHMFEKVASESESCECR